MAKLPENIYMTFTKETIKQLTDGIRKAGKTIVFTNGVFDILHYGHIDYLTKARQLGDVLIVGLNKDSSVKKFKSKGRPVQSELDRARILAALRAVDYVVAFTDETPAKLIEMVRPDVLVKGADYKISEIVGADFVKSYGGQVKRIRLAKGRSTSNIINKIKK
ncbi:MAG: D-glycero-beta-D-manno-heptose 1-phosphate adenylyltransferase [Candidatus Zixiibacteriota bacterium]